MNSKTQLSLFLSSALALSVCACGSNTGKEINSTPAAEQAEEALTEDALTEDSLTEDALTEDALTEDALTEDALTEATEDSSFEVSNTGSETAQDTSSTDSVELIVFAAASMTETLTQLGDAYMADHENVTIVFNFDSSGTLKTQIQEGADCDIFISAGQKQMNQLDITASGEVNTEGLDYILEGSRFDILENKVALAVPEENPGNINSYDDLIAGLEASSIMLAMGNADVPVGQYTQKILTYYNLSEEDLAAAGSITYGSNVKEVTTQVSEAVVDCGIIYQTDAFSAGLTIVDTATAEMCGQVIYPAAVLNISQNPEAAQEFLEFLTSDEADKVFEEVGFTPIA